MAVIRSNVSQASNLGPGNTDFNPGGTGAEPSTTLDNTNADPWSHMEAEWFQDTIAQYFSDEQWRSYKDYY